MGDTFAKDPGSHPVAGIEDLAVVHRIVGGRALP
jgi:hypothetical protein